MHWRPATWEHALGVTLGNFKAMTTAPHATHALQAATLHGMAPRFAAAVLLVPLLCQEKEAVQSAHMDTTLVSDL